MPSLDSRGPRIPAAGYAVGETGPCRVAVVQSMPSSLLRGSTHVADGHQLLGNRGSYVPGGMHWSPSSGSPGSVDRTNMGPPPFSVG